MIVDARGYTCPTPIIMLKQSLKTSETIEILIDNEISRDNILTFLRDNDYKYLISEQNNFWCISILNEENENINYLTNEYPFQSSRNEDISINRAIIVFKNDTMGFGDGDLGNSLIRGFFSVLSETEILPSHLIFYNAGVNLVTETSPVISNVKKLQVKGVKIVICGACIDFYNKK